VSAKHFYTIILRYILIVHDLKIVDKHKNINKLSPLKDARVLRRSEYIKNYPKLEAKISNSAPILGTNHILQSRSYLVLIVYYIKVVGISLNLTRVELPSRVICHCLQYLAGAEKYSNTNYSNYYGIPKQSFIHRNIFDV
jgi:hypothetical protein